jgi:uncharacterized protein (TIGR03435 family)
MLMLAVLLAAQLAFDVASIRPGRTDGISEFQIQGNRLSVSGMSLKDLVRRAYLGSDNAQDQARVIGAVSWMATETFDITANIDGDPGFDTQGRPQRLFAMLKTLLEDRFKLKVHAESREMNVYELIASDPQKRASALRASTLDCPVYPQGIPRPAPDPVRWCGVRTAATGPTVRVTAQGVTLADFANSLSRFRSIDRSVQDKSGLTDRFDFQFDFVAAAPPASSELTPSPEGASLFTVLQEQLGLKLQPAKASIDVVVIDSAERPTPN